MVMSRVEQYVSDTLAQVKAEKVLFPANFDLSARIHDAVNDIDAPMSRISTLLKSDPVLSAKIVALANSSFYNSRRVISSVDDATRLVGATAVQCIALSTAQRQLMARTSREVTLLLRQLWSYSMHVAATGYAIAGTCNKTRSVDPDTMLFCGVLLHLDVMFLLYRLTDYPELLEEQNITHIGPVIRALSGQVHTSIMDMYHIPEYLVSAMKTAYVPVQPLVCGLCTTDINASTPERVIASAAQSVAIEEQIAPYLPRVLAVYTLDRPEVVKKRDELIRLLTDF